MKTSFKIGLIIYLSSLLIAGGIILGFHLTQIITWQVQEAVVVLLVVIPVATLTWVLIVSLFIKPILYLNKVTKILASGNLGQKIQVKASGEIGELEQNLSTMTTNLISSMQHFASSLRNEKLKEDEITKSLVEVAGQKAKIEALLSSIDDGVVAIDQDDKIILFNKKASQMSGFTKEEALFKPYQQVLKFINEKDNLPAGDIIKQAPRSKAVDQSLHLALLKKNAEIVPVSQSTSLITDDKNQHLGVVVALRDITEERQLDHLKDEFVSVASHELRTPMTAIKGFVSMIMEGDYGKVSDELKDPLSDVSSSIERLIQLVNDLLDVSRIEANRVKIDLADVPVRASVQETANSLKPLTDSKGISLDYQEIGPETVYADPGKLKEILGNLIGNSLKFTDRGYIKISTQKKGDSLEISVKDTGIGIPIEEQSKLFNKFQQVSSTALGRPSGTGLGLYISREFARKMNGDLYLTESHPGLGSTFTITLPLSRLI